MQIIIEPAFKLIDFIFFGVLRISSPSVQFSSPSAAFFYPQYQLRKIANARETRCRYYDRLLGRALIWGGGRWWWWRVWWLPCLEAFSPLTNLLSCFFCASSLWLHKIIENCNDFIFEIILSGKNNNNNSTSTFKWSINKLTRKEK